MYLGPHDADDRKEWLLTNGLGGFASSTLAGVNTRRYHGWLVAHVARYGGRFVVLSGLEEEVVLAGQTYRLTSPEGRRRLQGFALDPLPVFTYSLDGAFVERVLVMPRGHNRIVAIYKFIGFDGASGAQPGSPGERMALRIEPLVTFRFYHHLLRANDWPFRVEAGPRWVTVQPHEGSPVLVFRHGRGRWTPLGAWRTGVVYEEELRRGLDHTEDLYSPGRLEFTGLGPGGTVAVSAALAEDEEEAAGLCREEFGPGVARTLRSAERRRLRGLARDARKAVRLRGGRGAGGPGGPEARTFFDRLVRATDAFVVVRSRRASGPAVAGPSGRPVAADGRTTVVAGYPWFEDWGRDTLVSLPGLFLVTGRYEEAFRVLEDYAAYVRGGLVPNRFPDQASEPDYNTADASLWLFWAAQAYLAYTGDRSGVRRVLLGPMRDIASAYLRGTRYGIGAGPDGLVHAGEPGVAVTWMDAKLGDWVVTPREGYPVEVNALWYNALRFLGELEGDGTAAAGSAGGDGDGPDRTHHGPDWAALAERVRVAFNARFWNPERNCLYDVVRDPGDGRPSDPSVRPNQLLAISLPHAVLDASRWKPVLETCLRELYTPFGLRTLSPSDRAYHPRYGGGPAERDAAYHQGTVWPWLVGPLVTALRRAAGRPEESRRAAARMLQPFAAHLREAGVGYISEVFDAEYPHRPGGCIAQAWSVAEVLRAYAEEILGARPPGGQHSNPGGKN